MRCRNRLAVVEGATHLFEEPGALATAANLASDWFVSYLLPGPEAGEAGEPAGLVGVAGGDDDTELRARPASDVQY